jgi:hypothetical protein
LGLLSFVVLIRHISPQQSAMQCLLSWISDQQSMLSLKVLVRMACETKSQEFASQHFTLHLSCYEVKQSENLFDKLINESEL